MIKRLNVEKTKLREVLDISVVLGLICVLVAFSVSFHFVDRFYNYLKEYASLPFAETMVNLLFLICVVLLWQTYRNWQSAEKKQKELDDIINSITSDVLLVVNSEDTIILCTDSIKRMFGYEVTEIISRKTDFLYYDVSKESEHWQVIYDILQKEGFDISFAKGRSKQGEVISLEIFAGTLHHNEGTVLLLRDVTQREKIEKMLRVSEKNFKEIIKKSADGIVIVDKKGLIQLANPASEKLFGIKMAQLLNKPFKYPISLEETVEIEIRDYREKPAIAEMRTVEMLWKGDDVYLISLRDITEHKNMQNNLKNALNVKSEFISMVSHELSTPLTIMKEYISIILAEISGDINNEQKKQLSIINGNIDRLSSMINDLLDISRIEYGKMKLFRNLTDVSHLITDVVNSFESKVKNKEIDLTYRFDKNLPKISIDGDRITQVFINLIGNAVKFTPIGGRIDIYTAKKDNLLEISITDTGPGIARDNFDRIFNHFERVEERGNTSIKGTGLGLAIAKKIVEMHDGAVWVESPVTTDSRGSKFTFILPLYESRKILSEHLSNAIEKAKNMNSVLSVAMIKIKDFEHIRSTVSKGEVQAMMEWMEDISRNIVRKSDDIITDYENGTILIIQLECNKEITCRIKEKINTFIREYIPALETPESKIALDFGLAVYPDDASSGEELILKAENDLEDLMLPGG
ncbi:ATP-binding protein [bacterium]